jgi:hypothetical protein
MPTNPLAPDASTDIDGPPVVEPDYNEPIQDPNSDPNSDPESDPGSDELPEEEPEDEVPEEDPDDEPLAEEDEELLVEPAGESDVEIDDEIFRQRHADAEARLGRSN